MSIKVVIDVSIVEALATQSGYARMSEKDRTTIVKRCQKGVNQSKLKTAEVQTEGELQGVHLIPVKIVFKWLLDDNHLSPVNPVH